MSQWTPAIEVRNESMSESRQIDAEVSGSANVFRSVIDLDEVDRSHVMTPVGTQLSDSRK